MAGKNIPEDIYDVVIVGGGPAGLTAGLYASRGRMKTLMVESFSVMGQATMTDMIENYPGVDKANGFELMTKFKNQASSFGMESRQGTVNKISLANEDGLPVWTAQDEGGEVKALSVVIATGASSKKLDAPGEKEFLGSGVSYCATCDAAFFKEKDIVVVGGGDTAVEEAIFLTRFGRKVTIVHRKDRLRATKIVQERAFANKKLEYAWDATVEAIEGKNKVEKIVIKNKKTGEVSDLPCDGVFIFVGWVPNTYFLKGVVDLDENGCVIVDSDMKTSAPGVFAGGDCCKKLLHQVVTACGDGATAAFSAQHYVERLKGTEYV